MDIPFFYAPALQEGLHSLTLPEDASRHILSVLRMEVGEALRLVDGQGLVATARIVGMNRKQCTVELTETYRLKNTRRPVTIAISLLRNADRFEWMLEKVTEIGVAAVIPLRCERTVRQQFRAERMHRIVVSAMLQSQQAWLTRITEPQTVEEVIGTAEQAERYIAHCQPGNQQLLPAPGSPEQSSLVLIGPEGDFTAAEIAICEAAGFRAVSLGANRLRTETAGVCAAVIRCIGS